jgi:hypothetical protein
VVSRLVVSKDPNRERAYHHSALTAHHSPSAKRATHQFVFRPAEFPVAQRGPKWHSAPKRRWLIPAL